MLALRLRQATAGVLVIGILLAFIGFCALLQVHNKYKKYNLTNITENTSPFLIFHVVFLQYHQVISSTVRTKGFVRDMVNKQRLVSSKTKAEYWRDKSWNDTNGLLWFVQVITSMIYCNVGRSMTCNDTRHVEP